MTVPDNRGSEEPPAPRTSLPSPTSPAESRSPSPGRTPRPGSLARTMAAFLAEMAKHPPSRPLQPIGCRACILCRPASDPEHLRRGLCHFGAGSLRRLDVRSARYANIEERLRAYLGDEPGLWWRNPRHRHYHGDLAARLMNLNISAALARFAPTNEDLLPPPQVTTIVISRRNGARVPQEPLPEPWFMYLE